MHRNEFETGDGIYLLSHSVGLPPKSARSAADEGFFEHWSSAGLAVWDGWFAGIDRFRAALAALLNGHEDGFCPQANLSSALTKILNAIPRQAGRDRIVYSESDFPTMGFVLQMAAKAGYRLTCIPDSADFGTLEPWDTVIDESCAAVLITHVHSNTSTTVPVRDICDLAAGCGALSIVDIAQSAGIVPIDIAAWNADFVVGSCVKFLCGGPGAGYLWVNDRVLGECEPTDVGWFSHENPFEFDIHNFRYAGNALKFWGGTPSVLPYVVAANSIELTDRIGIDTVRDYSLRMTQILIDRIDSQNVVTPSAPENRGGTVVLQFGEKQSEVANQLNRTDVHFDARPTGLRLSPHIYNTQDEIEAVAACILASA